MEKKVKNLGKKEIILATILVISISLITLSLTYAYFTSQLTIEEKEYITIKSGTLALTFKDNDNTIENIVGSWNFGDTIEKELIIENIGTRDTYAKISWDNLINTYLKESLTYTLEEKSDEVGALWTSIKTINKNVPQSISSSTQPLVGHLSIPAGHTYTYKLRITLENLENIDQTVDINAKLITKFTLEEDSAPNSLEKLITNAKTSNPDFANPATTDETKEGLYQMIDDTDNMSYYFRGAATNNYIKFGKNAEGQEMWWRIIRINGNGSIRMIYDGAGDVGNDTYSRGFALTSIQWNTNRDDTKYIGWMFGGENGVASTSKEEAQRNETDSNIKTKVDEWYKQNIYDTGYHNYISDEVFCNDRSISSGLGYGNSTTYYRGYITLGVKEENEIKPQFTCPQENDKFTVSKEIGNGTLTYPIGLITADEIVAAGSGKYNMRNLSYYLNKGAWYWSFSPYYAPQAFMFGVHYTGYLGGHYANNNDSVAPVINLKAEYLNQLQGTGNANDPFHLTEANN